MRPGLRRAQSKKSNKNKDGNIATKGERGSDDHRGISTEGVVFDIAGAYPIIPPRTSSFARGTRFESDFIAALNMSGTEAWSGSMTSAVESGSPTPGTPVFVVHQDVVETPHTPRSVLDDTTSAMTTTPVAGTSISAVLPAPASTPTGSTPLTTDDYPLTTATIPTPHPLSASRHKNDHHSVASSQVSLDASHSSVSRSHAAHPSSLATSWTNERNVDSLSGHGHDDGPVVKEEAGIGSDEEEAEESMIKSGEVIDLVEGEGEASVREDMAGDGERERGSEDVRGRSRSTSSCEGMPTFALAAPMETSEGEYVEEGHVVLMDATTEANVVWHPHTDDPLSKEIPPQLLSEADHNLRPDCPPAQEDVDARRTSIEFSEGCSSDADEKRRHVRRQRSSFKLSASEKLEQLRLKLKASSSPEPWDLIDPPVDIESGNQPGGHQEHKDGEKEKEHESREPLGSDYYSTLNSKNFATLQKSRRRPLIPRSSYYFGPPPPDCAYGTSPVGHIGVHHPREIIRIERDYASGEVVQFTPIYPLELDGRITATQFHETINDINEILISAHSVRHSFVYTFFAITTLQLSTLLVTSHYTKEMRRLQEKIEELNTQLYNPVGLNILWPRNVAFLFLEIEYY